MTEADFKKRSKNFAKEVIFFVKRLPGSRESEHLCRQLLRCSTSVGANYRSACRARSTSDMIAKLKIVEEEADESMFMLELLGECGLAEEKDVRALTSEADAILRMTVASIKTLREDHRVREYVALYGDTPTAESLATIMSGSADEISDAETDGLGKLQESNKS